MVVHDLNAAAFPTLDQTQIARLSSCTDATLKRIRAGERLFEVGDQDPRFFLVKSGGIEIVDESGETPKTLVVHGPGQFTGEVVQLTGGPTIVSAAARVDSEVYEISADALRKLLNQCPDLSDIILQAFIARRQLLRESAEFAGLRVIGSRYSQDTFRVRDFLSRNRLLFTWLDLEADAQVRRLLEGFGLTEADTPVVAYGHKMLLKNPSDRELADAIGIRRPLEQMTYDLAIVGGGPTGLAAAVYGASEGLSTVVLERTAPGGQAGASMRIENYLGFPMGVTGSELTDRAVLQATKFGARISVPTPVIGLAFENAYSILSLEGGETVAAKCLLIATGAAYRKLDVEGLEQFTGRGVYYAATSSEGELCRGADVLVVGGGNSAGQAAVFLAGPARKVFLVVRDGSLYKCMSSYLARRIEQNPKISVLLNTEVVRMLGGNHLTSVELRDKKTGQQSAIETPGLFSFCGAVPRTDWLPPEIERDENGFVRTGTAVALSPRWTGPRQPFLLETSRAGVFAAGDARSGSVKRVASGVGEGAMAVQFVHEYLREK